MTLRHLKIFVAVCEHGTMTRAAESLHMVQPTISYAITEMEKYYQVALFERVNQRLVITDMGKELLSKAKEVLDSFEDFEELASMGDQTRKVRVGLSLTLGQTLLPLYLNGLRDRHPSLDITVTVDKTANVEKELEIGNLDFGAVEGTPSSPHLQTVPFGSDALVCVCTPDYPAPQSVSLEELLSHRLLLRESGSACRELFDRELYGQRLLARPLLESASNESLLAAALGGHGIAVLPRSLVAELVTEGRLCEVEVTDANLTRERYLVYHRNKKFNTLQRKAFSALKEIGEEIK